MSDSDFVSLESKYSNVDVKRALADGHFVP
jgi:hypothetical protein